MFRFRRFAKSCYGTKGNKIHVCSFFQLAKIDRQEAGTLPAYVFYVLVVYYLQQCELPVLPCLHEV